eukprot:339517_1
MTTVNVSPWILSSSCMASYFLLYSCYDKQKKQLRIKKLKQIFGLKNVQYSLNEINKVLSLTGLTLLSLSFIPKNKLNKINVAYNASKIREHSLYLLTIHGSYSLYTFFDRYFGAKQFAMFFGSCSLTSLWLYKLEYLPSKYSIMPLMIGTIHFYTMETKPNGLQIRPYGYTALTVSLIAISLWLSNKLL